MLDKIFSWWSGATIGTLFTVNRLGVKVGEDEFGNRYFEGKGGKGEYDGRKRRWVIYNGYADASKVPAEWFGWLHHTYADPPSAEPRPLRRWEKPHLPNMSGTPYAYRPAGAISRGGERASATGDYQAWTPE